MSKEPNKPSPSGRSSRFWIYSGLLLLAAVGVMILGNLGDSGRRSGPVSVDKETRVDERIPSVASGHDGRSDGGEGPRKTRSNNRKGGEVTDLVPGEFPLVERIIADDNQTDIQAAAALAEIARRSDVSLEERFEALAHGLNLDFKSFAGLASEPALPVELAQRYLDELLNQNQHPIFQIEGCLALLSHADKDIQSQAAEQLAFLVEKESLVESPDELRIAASAKMEELRKIPPPPANAESGELPLDLSSE